MAVCTRVRVWHQVSNVTYTTTTCVATHCTHLPVCSALTRVGFNCFRRAAFNLMMPAGETLVSGATDHALSRTFTHCATTRGGEDDGGVYEGKVALFYSL